MNQSLGFNINHICTHLLATPSEDSIGIGFNTIINHFVSKREVNHSLAVQINNAMQHDLFEITQSQTGVKAIIRNTALVGILFYITTAFQVWFVKDIATNRTTALPLTLIQDGSWVRPSALDQVRRYWKSFR